LEAEAAAAATEKAWCDEQMAKTEEKKQELDEDIAKLTTKIDKASADSTTLKDEVKVLQSELADLAKLQAEMDSIRAEEHANFETAKADYELGLEGVRKALMVLRDYYGASASSALLQQPAKPELFAKASGAGGGIIDILEVCESDFASNLAKEDKEESDAQAEYDKVTQENAVTKTLKLQDVKYKTQEFTGLDKAISDMSADLATEKTELSAVMEYYGKVKDRCIAVPETYEERKARREAEIEGLKEALNILETQTALVQRGRRAGRRGSRSHFLAASP
jgi:archaellum component FlaC